jgi:hypothetical protein
MKMLKNRLAGSLNLICLIYKVICDHFWGILEKTNPLKGWIALNFRF